MIAALAVTLLAHPDAARALLDLLKSPHAIESIKTKGMEPG